MTDRAVILAAGRGTRMRVPAAAVPMDPAQRVMAERGLKGLIPFHGHPFLAHAVTALADAGIREVCLVVGPGDDAVRATFAAVPATRVRFTFAVQEEPRGSAHALLAAAAFAGEASFLVVNADNLYPPAVVRPLLRMAGPGFAGFRRQALIDGGAIPPDRVAAYAIVTTDDDGSLTDIIEKPAPAELRRFAGIGWISMTCWRFGPAIFEACRRVAPSRRGELELPDAVRLAATTLGYRIRVVPVDDAVLDLSRPEDIPVVDRRLRGARVKL